MKKETRGPSFISEPLIQYIVQLLDEIHRGYLLSPRFQRPFVWKLERRLDLMRSIRDGIPIGSILVWRTHRPDITTYNVVGPHAVTAPQTGEGTIRQYLLDGVQRLSTLYGALYPQMEGRKTPEGEDFTLYYDLKNGDFVGADQDPAEGYYLPLSVVLDSKELLKFERGLADDTLIERADDIARTFREYKIPIIPIVSDNLEMATRTFQRINSQGQVMSEVHMVNALTWTSEFDLLERLDELKAEKLTPLGWGSLEDDVILKTCKTAIGPDLYQVSTDDLSNRLKSTPSALEEAVDNLVNAIIFLRDKCGVPNTRFLPYTFQAILLAEAFRRRPQPNKTELELLTSWFWLTTFGELFAAITKGRVKRINESLIEALETGALIWPGAKPFHRRPIGPRFDMRHSRSRALALLLAHKCPLDDQGLPVKAWEALTQHGAEAIMQLIPWSDFPANAKDLHLSPANRFIMPPDRAVAFRHSLLAPWIPGPEALLQSHVIPRSALEALKVGNYEGFINIRLAALDELERAWLTPIERIIPAR